MLDQDKVIALAKELKISPEDIKEGYRYDIFEIDGDSEHAGEEWMVLTEDEADQEAKDQLISIMDDLGLEAFTPSFQEWILENCIDGDWFREAHEEDCWALIDEFDYEGDDEFGTRLVRELYDADLVTDDDFEVNEEGEVDHSQLLEDVDTEELKSALVDHMMDTEPNHVEWFKNTFGTGELYKLVKDGKVDLDTDMIVQECIEQDGRGHFISYYNSVEVELADDNGYIDYLAYRLN